jgi:hypothetical protein
MAACQQERFPQGWAQRRGAFGNAPYEDCQISTLAGRMDAERPEEVPTRSVGTRGEYEDKCKLSYSLLRYNYFTLKKVNLLVWFRLRIKDAC